MLLAWTFALGLGLAPLAGCQQLSNWNTGVASFYVSKGLSLTDAPFELRPIQQLKRAWHGVANWRTESLQRAIAGAQPPGAQTATSLLSPRALSSLWHTVCP